MLSPYPRICAGAKKSSVSRREGHGKGEVDSAARRPLAAARGPAARGRGPAARGQTDLEVFVEKLLNRSDPEATREATRGYRSDPEATEIGLTPRLPQHFCLLARGVSGRSHPGCR